MGRVQTIRLLVPAVLLLGCLEPAPAVGPTAVELGLEIYAKYCGFCHGAQGEGYVSPAANALANQDFLKAADDPFLEMAVEMGRPDTKMSAWASEYGGPLTPEDVSNLVAAIRSWQTEASDTLEETDSTGDATGAVAVYEKECSSCHGAAGEGTALALSLNNPVFLASASDAFLRHAIVVGRRNTLMKSYQGILTESQVEDLIALVRSWQKPIDMKKFEPPVVVEIVLNPDGPEPEFEIGVEYIGVDTVKAEYDKGARMAIIDARPPGDYAVEHITGAANIPFFEIEARLSEIPEDTWVISYCGCPHDESGIVATAIRGSGHEKVAILDEGYFDWLQKGYPVTTAD